ncbi:TPA: hypothetical protein DHW51_20420 [Candidatus Poribacteria bacterium]|nr:hypothetical protein [Candidatus Poribacteria bacterium]HCK16503.1 hypothetical protein [Candidatus Poribacteria bacterium]|tara:strand:- start:3290 stop:3724 length:435 start_codon:yes stop_codon:yes gene_type:complete
MVKRNLLLVWLLTSLTQGLYTLFWYVKTKREMTNLGESIRPAWMLIIPVVNWYWLWNYSQAVSKVINQKLRPITVYKILISIPILSNILITGVLLAKRGIISTTLDESRIQLVFAILLQLQATAITVIQAYFNQTVDQNIVSEN